MLSSILLYKKNIHLEEIIGNSYRFIFSYQLLQYTLYQTYNIHAIDLTFSQYVLKETVNEQKYWEI